MKEKKTERHPNTTAISRYDRVLESNNKFILFLLRECEAIWKQCLPTALQAQNVYSVEDNTRTSQAQ